LKALVLRVRLSVLVSPKPLVSSCEAMVSSNKASLCLVLFCGVAFLSGAEAVNASATLSNGENCTVAASANSEECTGGACNDVDGQLTCAAAAAAKKANGVACAVIADCVSNYCASSVCADEPVATSANGVACANNAACTSGVCSTTCRGPDGTTCAAANECAGTFCNFVTGVSGAKHCANAAPLKADNEACTAPNECTGNFCNSNQCASSAALKADGEACTAANQCTGNNCNEEFTGCNEGKKCAASAAPAKLADGVDCTEACACAGGFCNFKSGFVGAKMCAAADQPKLANGGACTMGWHCVSNVCTASTCALAPNEGATCASNSDCSGFCKVNATGNNTCAAKLADDAACTSADQCVGALCKHVNASHTCASKATCGASVCPAATHVPKGNANALKCASDVCASSDAQACCDARQQCQTVACESNHQLKANVAATDLCAGAACDTGDSAACCVVKPATGVQAACAASVCTTATHQPKSNIATLKCAGENCTAAGGADQTACCDAKAATVAGACMVKTESELVAANLTRNASADGFKSRSALTTQCGAVTTATACAANVGCKWVVTAKKANGEACTAAADCTGGYCNALKCAAAGPVTTKANGETCTAAADCTGGFCNGATESKKCAAAALVDPNATAPVVKAKKFVGSFTMKVSDAAAFKTNAKVKVALQTAIADTIDGVSKEHVTITKVSDAPASGRRLNSHGGSVKVEYEINLPKTYTGAASTLTAASMKAALPAATLMSNINAAITAADVADVSVTEAPVVADVTMTEIEATTTKKAPIAANQAATKAMSVLAMTLVLSMMA